VVRFYESYTQLTIFNPGCVQLHCGTMWSWMWISIFRRNRQLQTSELMWEGDWRNKIASAKK